MKNVKYYLPIFLFLFLLTACEKDFEDLNRNPYFPTQTDVGPLFNTVIESLQLGWDEQFYLHNDTYYEITQQCALGSRFSTINTNGTENAWQNYYAALAHIREIEQRFAAYEGEPEALYNVQAMLKIILAYKTFRLTDQFGDIPFFEAGKGFEGLEYLRPKFDPQSEIYPFLLDELKWAAENINPFPNPVTASGQAYVNFGDFDTFLEGDMHRWRKFANSLRLRHAMRMIEKDPAFAEPIIKEIIENDLPIIETGEEIVLNPRTLSWKKQSTHWSFREHKGLRMGTTIWNLMSESDEPGGSGIFDPRARFFFEPNNEGAWRPFPQNPDENTEPAGGIPYQGQRDSNFDLKGQDNIYSPVHYYLIRDENDVPEILLTAAEMHFIKAEAYFRGLGVAADVENAEEAYTLGIVASITMWQDIVSNTEIWQNAPEPLSQGNIYGVAYHPKLSFLTNDDQLQLIYNQRWIDAFRQPWEAYALGRRTGQTPREGAATEHYRLAYPPSEVENNPDNWATQVSKMGDDSHRTKVWWME